MVYKDERRCISQLCCCFIVKQINKSESGIIVITFPDKKNKYTYQEDMEKKTFLKDNNLSFTKNFKSRDSKGVIENQMQRIGQYGKSARYATAFIHIISDEDSYNENEQGYLSMLVGNLVKSMNHQVSERTTQFEDIEFKVPLTPHTVTMTKEPLSNFFTTEDCTQLFTFIYSKDIEAYSNTEQLFVDYPHITKEFLGSDTENNRKLLKRAHGTS